MNWIELGLLVFSFAPIWLFFIKIVKLKKSSFLFVLFLVAIFLSVNKATQIVTADENGYITAFANMSTAMDRLSAGVGISKSVYEYKISQLIIAIPLSVFPKEFFTLFGNYGFEIIYKALHWLWSLGLSLGIVYVYHKLISQNNNNAKAKAENTAITFIFILSVPVSLLMFKVANYDGFSVLLSVLALLFSVAGLLHNNYKIAVFSTVIATLAGLEKSSATIFWPICLTVLLLTVFNQKLSAVKKLAISAGAVCASVFISYLVLQSIYFVTLPEIQNNFAIDASKVLFPFIYFLIPLFTPNEWTMANFNTANPFALFLIVIVACITAAVMMKIITVVYYKQKVIKNSHIIRAIVVILIISCLCGIVFSLFSATRIAPFYPVEGAESNMNLHGADQSWKFHYGSNTQLGYEITNISSHYGLLAVSFPTIAVAFLIVFCFIAFKHSDKETMTLMLVVLGCVCLPVLLALLGQPGLSSRYYGTLIILGPIIMLGVVSKHLSNYMLFVARKNIAVFSIITVCWFSEILLFFPNVTAFSPVWNVFSQKLNDIPQKGVWHNGEVMMWGEDIALSGERINKYVNKSGKEPNNFTIISNYGQDWYANPGYELKNVQDIKKEDFEDDNTFISLSRFAIFRKDIPLFLTEIKPFDTIKMNGMTTVWIYKAKQLNEYSKYFLEE